MEEHKREMLALRKASREEMTLRVPVEYWRSRQQNHKDSGLRVLGMFTLLLAITGSAIWLAGARLSIVQSG